MIVVTFRNMANGVYSIHPHGVAYGKQSEGKQSLTELLILLADVADLKTAAVRCQSAGVTVDVHDVTHSDTYTTLADKTNNFVCHLLKY